MSERPTIETLQGLQSLFERLRKTRKFPALTFEHVALTAREFPQARLEAEGEDLVLTAMGMDGGVGHTMAWLRAQASRIELRKTGGYRDGKGQGSAGRHRQAAGPGSGKGHEEIGDRIAVPKL